jgi:hypothetical protein
LRIINQLFGEKPVPRVAKAILYVVWVMLVLGWLAGNGPWTSIGLPVCLVGFMIMGLFMTFASKDDLIDFWRPNSRIGRGLADPTQGNSMHRFMRFIGIAFVIAVLFVGYKIIYR